MKKIFLISICFLSLSIVQAQRNSFSFGNKSLKEAEKVIALFNEQIESFQHKANGLKETNESLWARFSAEGQESKLARESYAINSRLIVEYEEEILAIEKMKKDFIFQISLQGEKALRFRTSNPAKIKAAAEAYSIISYTDAMSSATSQKDAGVVNKPGQLKGLAVNDHYEDAIVLITGPGGFQRSSPLKKNGGEFYFNVPYPGTYVFIFQMKTGVERVTVRCEPGQSIFYDKQGLPYDLKATLMSSW